MQLNKTTKYPKSSKVNFQDFFWYCIKCVSENFLISPAVSFKGTVALAKNRRFSRRFGLATNVLMFNCEYLAVPAGVLRQFVVRKNVGPPLGIAQM